VVVLGIEPGTSGSSARNSVGILLSWNYMLFNQMAKRISDNWTDDETSLLEYINHIIIH
jgi:hypothetical protein